MEQAEWEQLSADEKKASLASSPSKDDKRIS